MIGFYLILGLVAIYNGAYVVIRCGGAHGAAPSGARCWRR